MKTTRILLLAMIPALMLGSCVKENQIDKTGIDTGKNDVSGEVPVNIVVADSDYAETRGVPTTIGTLNTKTVKLYAYQRNGANYVASDTYPMTSGITATISGSSMSLGSTYYWPMSNLLDFYAVYPETWAASVAQDGVTPFAPTITTGSHAVATSMDSQTDVLYAYTTGTTKGTAVPIQFLHALTRVTFQGKILNNDPEKITGAQITGITIKNVDASGTFAFKDATGIWTPSGTKHPTVSTGTLTYAFVASPGTTDPGDYIGSFFLIPMSNPAESVTLEVTVKTNNTGTNTYSVALPSGIPNWVAGQWVNYTIQLDANNGQVNIGAVTVKPWGTAGEPDHTGTVPIN